MPRIIAYTYEGGMHCPACTAQRWRAANAKRADEHGVDMLAQDNEGNALHPVFDTDERPWRVMACDTCSEVL